jgi:hypothetical protein
MRTNPEARRTLVYFPVLHTETDMGDMAPMLRRAGVERQGLEAWQANRHRIATTWRDVRAVVDGLGTGLAGAMLYQDSLPVCGHEQAIVRELAQGGSLNHQLLCDLMAQGAELVGTESGELLLKDYELIKRAIASVHSGAPAGDADADAARRSTLLVERDRYIAGRIDETLIAGRIGILFLGALHDVRPWLAPDIEVHFPLLTPITEADADEAS